VSLDKGYASDFSVDYAIPLLLKQFSKRSAMYIPPGFNTVTPYFFVADAESFVRFLV
jgi:hypothetical protein